MPTRMNGWNLKRLTVPSIGKKKEQSELLSLASGNKKKDKTTLENSLAVSNKDNHITIVWLNNSTYRPKRNENRCPQKDLYIMSTAASFKMERVQVSISCWINKLWCILHNGILINNEK